VVGIDTGTSRPAGSRISRASKSPRPLVQASGQIDPPVYYVHSEGLFEGGYWPGTWLSGIDSPAVRGAWAIIWPILSCLPTPKSRMRGTCYPWQTCQVPLGKPTPAWRVPAFPGSRQGLAGRLTGPLRPTRPLPLPPAGDGTTVREADRLSNGLASLAPPGRSPTPPPFHSDDKGIVCRTN
jgi:hypothetical protein